MKATSTFLRNTLFIFLLLGAMPVCAANYYWVGGTGHWSDYNGHWATQSGGQVYYNHAPTPQDTVIFDSLSFIGNNDTVYASSNTQYCHTMKWLMPDSMPVLYGTDPKTKLKIYGSMLLDTAMTWNFAGQLIFFGTDSGNAITTCGKPLGFILFSGDTLASWTLQDTLRCAHLIFRSGNFYSRGNTILTGTYEQDDINHSRQFLDTSMIYCSQFRNNHNPLQFDADSSTFIVTGNWLDGGGLTFGAVILPGITFVTGNNTIEHLTCYGNSRLSGSNTIGTLTGGEPGIVLSLYAGTTQTITDSIEFNGACTGMSAFICTTINATASIDFMNTAATLDRVFLENVNATGNGATANNSVLINSGGWSITNVAVQRNLYWVDGTGAWSDTSHWSLNPGGTGGECAPTPIDNVRFDALSFINPSEYVVGDLDVEFCHDMDWTGAANSPAYSQDTGMIMCYGYFLIPQPITAFDANMTMRSAQVNTPVATASATLKSITFDGDGGWSMQSTLQASGIYFVNGDFKSSGYNITAAGTVFPMESPGNMDFSGSVVSSPDWSFNGASGNFFAP
ncbi:MAG TPA: hypothetical protein VK826_09695, partial [Bacteroidia bacterium]|nr:hypothetical protein [Bacteroidia bacterium]